MNERAGLGRSRVPGGRRQSCRSTSKLPRHSGVLWVLPWPPGLASFRGRGPFSGVPSTCCILGNIFTAGTLCLQSRLESNPGFHVNWASALPLSHPPQAIETLSQTTCLIFLEGRWLREGTYPAVIRQQVGPPPVPRALGWSPDLPLRMPHREVQLWECSPV